MQTIFFGLVTVSITVGIKTNVSNGWLVFGIGLIVMGLIELLSD